MQLKLIMLHLLQHSLHLQFFIQFPVVCLPSHHLLVVFFCFALTLLCFCPFQLHVLKVFGVLSATLVKLILLVFYLRLYKLSSWFLFICIFQLVLVFTLLYIYIFFYSSPVVFLFVMHFLIAKQQVL